MKFKVLTFKGLPWYAKVKHGKDKRSLFMSVDNKTRKLTFKNLVHILKKNRK